MFASGGARSVHAERIVRSDGVRRLRTSGLAWPRMEKRTDDALLLRIRAIAIAATMVTLTATALTPAQNAVDAPATTTQAFDAGPITTTQATRDTSTGPTTLTVVVETRPVPRTRPTTQQIQEIAREGDVFRQAGEAIDNLGVRETLSQTSWWEWWFAAFAAMAGLFIGRFVTSLLKRVGRRESDKLQLIRAVTINSFAGPLGTFIAMVGIGFGLSRLELTPEVVVILLRGWQLAMVGVVGWLLYNLVEVVSLLILRASRGRQGNLSMMLVPVTRRTLRATIIILLLLFTLYNVFGVKSISGVLAGVGIAGLAVSLAAQDMLKNLFGSLMIYADQPFVLGDLIKVDAFEGIVEDIGFRSTRIRTADGFLITIPNAKVADAAVTNYSRRKSIRRVMDVALPYDTTPGQVDQALAILADVLADPSVKDEIDAKKGTPTVALDEFRPNGMRARAIYWFRAADATAYAAHSQRVNRLLHERFASANIRFVMAN
jgi:MscS family membrane protein